MPGGLGWPGSLHDALTRPYAAYEAGGIRGCEIGTVMFGMAQRAVVPGRLQSLLRQTLLDVFTPLPSTSLDDLIAKAVGNAAQADGDGSIQIHQIHPINRSRTPAIRIAEDAGYDFDLLEGVVGVNNEQFDRVATKTVELADGSVDASYGVAMGIM